ncbi:hypothetical protein QOZ80_2AG0144760 [Eleusine coracana subsp. coracana]|nr:hypothetical protein QOZ80_2AG0144760 [Eleusine coracana subsp. coracana]
MICFKNAFSILPRLLRDKPAIPAQPPQSPRPRCYYTFRHRPALRRPPPSPTPPRRHHYNDARRQQGGSRGLSKENAKFLLVILVTGGTVITVRYGTVEAVPFTNRTHFIVLTPSYERSLGVTRFDSFKTELRSRILPPDDPRSIRVRLIAEEIVQALHRCLDGGHCHGSDSYDDGEDPTATSGYGDIKADLAIKKRDEKAHHRVGEVALADDESLNCAKEQIGKLLEGWEVIVVKDSMINAICLPGGKIVVFTGLLDKFEEDAEIATVLGTRMEMEADHVGLMLLAAAGYDPRVAPGVYEKLGNLQKIQYCLVTSPLILRVRKDLRIYLKNVS